MTGEKSCIKLSMKILGARHSVNIDVGKTVSKFSTPETKFVEVCLNIK